MANLRPNDEIDKIGIWSKANSKDYDEGYDNINWDNQKTEKTQRQGEEND